MGSTLGLFLIKQFMEQLPDELLRELAGESYRLIVAKLPKYVQRELAETT